MKTVKIIISLLAVLLFCAVLTACAEEDKEQPKQNAVQNAAVTEKEPVETPAVDDQDERDRRARERDKNTDSEDDRLGPGDKPSDGQDERDREARARDDQAKQERERREQEERERREQEERERREQERREQEQQQEEEQQQRQQTGNYEHHIGDAVFYTEHDLWQYVFPNPKNPSHSRIGIKAMLADVWNVEGIYDAKDSYAGTDGSSFNCAVSFGYVDGKSGSYFTVSRTGERQYSTIVIARNEQTPPGGFLIVDGESSGFGFTPDMAALLLYALEQTQLNPRSNIGSELALPSNYECRSY